MSVHTRLTELLGLEHPIVLGGMGGGATCQAWSARSRMPEAWVCSG
jgi:NAD(P)H-dependent flavin oxidoreductase YrpB (nitropropane dioxygenase family)